MKIKHIELNLLLPQNNPDPDLILTITFENEGRLMTSVLRSSVWIGDDEKARNGIRHAVNSINGQLAPLNGKLHGNY